MKTKTSFRLIPLVVILLLRHGFSQTYTTQFDAVENPISEGGAWHNSGLDFHFIRTDNGIAYGTQTAGGYSDSYALLSGFPADQTAWAVIHLVRPIPDDGHTHEAEILLRFTDAPHSAKGYECLFDQGGGIQLVSWNGAMGDFTVLNPTEYGSTGPIKDGDTLKASIAGNVITMYINGKKRAQLTDSRHATGNPGMGLCCGTLATNAYYCYTSYTAVGGSGTGVESGGLQPGPLSLGSNSPNPFRSVTAFHYQLSSPGRVALRVHDMTGRLVATLVNEKRDAGNYTVRFDASKLPDGVYTAKLSAGGALRTRKLLLLK